MCGLRGGSGAQLYPQSSYVHPTEKVCNYQYTHPSTKQCNYSYTHPTSKQCTWSPDLSNYATKSELNSVSSPWKQLQSFSGSGTITGVANSSYSFFLFAARWSDTPDYKSRIHLSGSDGVTVQLINNDSTSLKNGTVAAYIRRISLESWGGRYSIYFVSEGGNYGDPEIITGFAETGRDGALNLYVSGHSGFSAKLYGIA